MEEITIVEASELAVMSGIKIIYNDTDQKYENDGISDVAFSDPVISYAEAVDDWDSV